MPFLSICFMNAMGSLRMQAVWLADWRQRRCERLDGGMLRELRPGSGHGLWCVVTWADHQRGQRRGPGNSVSSESDVKPLSALPGWWCLPPGIYRCQHPRETILNNLSSSLQSGEMSPVHLEIADWQLPFLGLSRSNPSHSYNYLNSKQGLSLLTHIFIISTLTRLL